MTLRINMWTGPRNISTTMMYSFASRSDVSVVDEPLYGYYLKETGAPHPGAEEVIAAMETDADAVIENVILAPCETPILFIKNMTHHLVGVDRRFLAETANILLTRDPREMLPSLAKNIPNPEQSDTGYEMQTELLDQLLAMGQTPAVLDARQVLLNPRSVLETLCAHLDIPFEESMLEWEAGPRPEDGVWAKYWYANVHRSTGFMAYKPKTEPFPEHLEPLLAECIPHYERLLDRAIKA